MQPAHTPDHMASSSRATTLIVGAAASFVGLLVVGAIGLWAWYGTAVFFEMVKTGIAACM
ncbi:hypothetical protein E0H22_03155 [Rhodopseudomonas boonkerdii]|uniref:hypothetical protein n=1 Tax=Rhodopseudomonas boonkerdii TaxID=475937 RepID=UPI001E5879F7|nr:hypothetical protein [Rhodopseudomonas boonkerdii]UGV24767.1 hypothetical protein E0H22_03155 [Rhodopseudomonas boonkerdii]